MNSEYEINLRMVTAHFATIYCKGHLKAGQDCWHHSCTSAALQSHTPLQSKWATEQLWSCAYQELRAAAHRIHDGANEA